MTSSLHREAQAFVDKFEGALGKGKGRKWYAYKVMMTKVRNKMSPFYFTPDFILVGVFFQSALLLLFLNLRNGSSSRGILRISEQPVSPGRGRSKRWKVSFVYSTAVFTS